ncbi:dihydrofolate reductase [Candidatus Uhrbacteria bacterium CG_4_9_14_3_um_filter_50_9]|uniref:Dihydrofolate reductase n=1 Tax=Candidatus Uhrbacteria bacterium CG_4_9_14_3_um_filter_50_9 TaxID=1975035 RepID=A0A2M7XBS9_9BACT|nr:MAG: dihydrofolate reductase [Candidatus Uhrbacteria bacterium CG_4_9_14_3_um_filter_50_9]
MKVILVAAMSADGKIAESPEQNSLDWTSKEDTAFFVKKTKEAGLVIMGQTTFQTIGKPLKDRRLIVLTREPEQYPSQEGIEFVNVPVQTILDTLTQEGVEQVVIAGGSSVYSQFLQGGHVTDIFLTVEPLLFGEGIPLASGFDRVHMELVEVGRIGEHGVLIHYRVK